MTETDDAFDVDAWNGRLHVIVDALIADEIVLEGDRRDAMQVLAGSLSRLGLAPSLLAKRLCLASAFSIEQRKFLVSEYLRRTKGMALADRRRSLIRADLGMTANELSAWTRTFFPGIVKRMSSSPFTVMIIRSCIGQWKTRRQILRDVGPVLVAAKNPMSSTGSLVRDGYLESYRIADAGHARYRATRAGEERVRAWDLARGEATCEAKAEGSEAA